MATNYPIFVELFFSCFIKAFSKSHCRLVFYLHRDNSWVLFYFLRTRHFDNLHIDIRSTSINWKKVTCFHLWFMMHIEAFCKKFTTKIQSTAIKSECFKKLPHSCDQISCDLSSTFHLDFHIEKTKNEDLSKKGWECSNQQENFFFIPPMHSSDYNQIKSAVIFQCQVCMMCVCGQLGF